MQIRIFQIDQAKDEHRAKFMSLEFLKKQNIPFNPNIYKLVYQGNVDCNNLEDVYTKFNIDHPPNHCGHSLSVSDIVEVVNNGDCKNDALKPDIGCYFCSDVGFKKINFDVTKAEYPERIMVVIVEPLKKPYIAEIDASLRAAQHAVSGEIGVIHSKIDNILIVTNKNGFTNKMPPNRSFKDDIIFGTFFICGDGEENFRSLNEKEIERYVNLFSSIENFSEDNLNEHFLEIN